MDIYERALQNSGERRATQYVELEHLAIHLGKNKGN